MPGKIENAVFTTGTPVRLVQACLCAGKTGQRSFNLRGSTMKHLHACLSAREVEKAVFIAVEAV